MFAKLSLSGRALARLLTLASATALVVLVAVAPTALAAGHRPVARMAVAAPSTGTVSGSIRFAARHVAPGVRRVVFSIDGSHRWTALRAPYRYHRTGVLNTRKLRNGAHLLVVKAIMASHSVRVARHRVIVHNTRSIGAIGADIGVHGPTTNTPGPDVALFNRVSYQFSTSLPMAQEAGRYSYFVLQATDARLIPSLHQLNPAAKIFMYQDPKLSRQSDTQGLTVCSIFSQLAAHPDWFIRDSAGNPISPPGGQYAGNYIMDIGNPAYQQYCLAHATALAKQDGFDGIYFDDFSAVLNWNFPAGHTTPQYTTDSAWQNAMYSMIAYAGAQTHAAGLLAVGNIGGAWTTPGLWAKWNGPLDGASEEDWGGTGSVALQLRTWAAKQADAQWSAANGKIAILHSYATTESNNTFDLASMLLTANGKTSYSTSNSNYTSNETWYPEYNTAQRLGAPSGPERTLGNGIRERVFAHGIILVNPTTASTPQISLGGDGYTGSGLHNATHTTLAGHGALILLKTS